MGVVWVRMGVVPIGYFGWVLFCTHWVLIHQLAAEIPDWLCFIGSTHVPTPRSEAEVGCGACGGPIKLWIGAQIWRKHTR